MSFNGSGIFNRLYSWIQQRNAGFDIDSTKFDAEDNGFAAGLSNCICRDGQSTIVADISFGGNKITNLADPLGAQDAVTKNYVQNVLGAGQIFGLTLSNDGVAPNTVLDIATGSATSDDQSTGMQLATAYTKTVASWAVGSANGALDTGSIAVTSWYHVFLIERLDTGVVDILFSLSPTAPTLPSGYTKKRRIGSFVTDVSGHIRGFSQNGDEFLFTIAASTQTSTLGSTAVALVLGVPSGVVVNALFRAFAQNAGASIVVLMNSLVEGNVAANSPLGNVSLAGLSGTTAAGHFNIRTNTAQQIRAVAANASTTLDIGAYGWIDTRGK